MGAWGVGIKQDDTVLDVLGDFDDHLKHGATIREASERVKSDFQTDDPDDTPLQWLALAYAQWSFGALDDEVLERVRGDITSGAGVWQWEEEGARVLYRRKEVLNRFLKQITTQNPKPRKIPRFVIRKPKFQTGDCLSVKLITGEYGAALVLATDHSDIEYGKNLIGVLEYRSTEPPDIRVFEQRNWLRLTHHNYKGDFDIAWYGTIRFRSEADRFIVVGSIPIYSTDPNESKTFSGWNRLGKQIILQMQM